MPEWRYVAQRVGGDQVFLDFNLPLTAPTVTRALSGAGSIEGTISPALGRLRDADGRLIIEEWGTAIYAVRDDKIEAGAIVTKSAFSGPDWSISAIGFTGYPQGMPYIGGWFGVEVDPTNVFREIWRHLQSYANGNLGIVIDPLLTGVKIGVALDPSEYDPGGGEPTYESGEVKLADYLDQDMGRVIDDLVVNTPFDFVEEHSWTSDAQVGIRHYVRLGYPRIGNRRDNLRFVYGENLAAPPDVERNGEEYADEILVLGNGEGRDMIRTVYGQPGTRLRRVATVVDKNLLSTAAVTARARQEYLARFVLGEITEVAVRDHPNAPLDSVELGDEIFLQFTGDWVEINIWVRVLAISITPEAGDTATLTVVRSEQST